MSPLIKAPLISQRTHLARETACLDRSAGNTSFGQLTTHEIAVSIIQAKPGTGRIEGLAAALYTTGEDVRNAGVLKKHLCVLFASRPALIPLSGPTLC